MASCQYREKFFTTARSQVYTGRLPAMSGELAGLTFLAFQQREKSVKYATIYYERLKKSQNTLIYYIQNKKFRYLIIYHANL